MKTINNLTNSALTIKDTLNSSEDSSQSDLTDSFSIKTETDNEQKNLPITDSKEEERQKTKNNISLGRKSNYPMLNFDKNKLRRRSLKINKFSKFATPTDRSDSLSSDHSKTFTNLFFSL